MSNPENPYPYAWFIRGTQSAIFYYLSCTPCYRVRNQRARARQDRRDRALRAEIEATGPEMQMLYKQPEAYKTNEYWAEEIGAGPGPPPQRAKKRKAKEGSRLVIAEPVPVEQQCSMDGSMAVVAGSDETGTNASARTDQQHPHSTINDMKSLLHHPVSSLNNRLRNYQREDEELWGLSMASTPPSSTDSSSTHTSQLRQTPTSHHNHFSMGHIGPSITAGLARLAQRQEPSAGSFYAARNPPVNDLHPPIVSVPVQSREANRWMLQPPPTAGIMSGVEVGRRAVEDGSGRGSPNASANGEGSSSRGSLKNEKGLHRKMSRRLVEEKRKRLDENSFSLQPVGPDVIERSRSARNRRKQMASEESTNSTGTVVRNTRDREETPTPELADNTTLSLTGTTGNTGRTSRRDFATTTLPPLTPLKWEPHLRPSNSRRRRPTSSDSPRGISPSCPHTPTSQAKTSANHAHARTWRGKHERQLSSTTRSYLFAYPLPLPTPWKEDPEFARRARREAWGARETPLELVDAEEDMEGRSPALVESPAYSPALSPTVNADAGVNGVMIGKDMSLDGGVGEASVSQESVLDVSHVVAKRREVRRDFEEGQLSGQTGVGRGGVNGGVDGEEDGDAEEMPPHSWNEVRKRWSVGF